MENRIAVRLSAVVAGAKDPVDALTAASLAWVGLAGDPVIQRVVLIDAPSVLGWDRWRAAGGEQSAQEAVRELLQAIADSGRLTPGLVGPFAPMILAALDEIALVIARAEDPETALAEGLEAVRELLRRVLVP